MVNDPRIVTAARLGKVFGTDPLAILDVSDTEWVLRVACANVIAKDNEEEARRIEQNRS